MSNNKQNMILTIIAIVVLFLAVIGATFAFFASQNTGKKDVNINAESGATDVLSFNLEDKDIASETIIDEDKENTEIIIKANMSNFNEESINVGDGVIGQAILLANDATKSASDNYYVYLNITKNELDYSTVGGKAELILQVKKIDKSKPLEEQEEVITQIDGLDYISSEDPKYENTEGFDITKKRGLIKISQSDIETSDEIKDQGRDNLSNMTTHEWEIKIILVNLKENQNENTNKTFTGTIMMQKEEYVPEYQKTINKLLQIANKEGETPTLIKHNTEELNRKYSDMVNKELNANDDAYRYSGSSENVQNYVCLDGSTSENECSSDADLYRIIGFFQNDNGEYEMKLIKATNSTEVELGNNVNAQGGTFVSEKNYRWNSTNGINDTDNSNMWKYSNLNKVNLNDFYYKYITGKVEGLEANITNHLWWVGGASGSSKHNAKQFYDNELGNGRLKQNDNLCLNSEYMISGHRLCNEENDLTFQDHIGLMYGSDYAYAAYPEAWHQKINLDSGEGYGLEDVMKNNWLYDSGGAYTISRENNSYTGVWNIYYAGILRGVGAFSTDRTIKPCFYLNASTRIANGDGTHDNPFRLSWN